MLPQEILAIIRDNIDDGHTFKSFTFVCKMTYAPPPRRFINLFATMFIRRPTYEWNRQRVLERVPLELIPYTLSLGDGASLSINKYLTIKFVEDHPNLDWNFVAVAQHCGIPSIFDYNEDDCRKLIKRRIISVTHIIDKFPSYHKIWKTASYYVDLTFIEHNMQIRWSWKEITIREDLTTDFIKKFMPYLNIYKLAANYDVTPFLATDWRDDYRMREAMSSRANINFLKEHKDHIIWSRVYARPEDVRANPHLPWCTPRQIEHLDTKSFILFHSLSAVPGYAHYADDVDLLIQTFYKDIKENNRIATNLSYNPNITDDILARYPEFAWKFSSMMLKNIPFSYVMNNDRRWDRYCVSSMKVTIQDILVLNATQRSRLIWSILTINKHISIHDILANLHLPWHIDRLSSRRDITPEIIEGNPHIDWDLNVVFTR